jgi:hypothetical protein
MLYGWLQGGHPGANTKIMRIIEKKAKIHKVRGAGNTLGPCSLKFNFPKGLGIT